MDRSAVFELLHYSERNQTFLRIKTLHQMDPFVGSVERVLNQLIILKSKGEQELIVAIDDIESVVEVPRQSRSIRKAIANLFHTFSSRHQKASASYFKANIQ